MRPYGSSQTAPHDELAVLAVYFGLRGGELECEIAAAIGQIETTELRHCQRQRGEREIGPAKIRGSVLLGCVQVAASRGRR